MGDVSLLDRPREAIDASEAVSARPEGGNPYSDEVVAALRTLAPEQRAVIVLRYLLEYTPTEIARVLELPRGTVNSRLRRALDRLRENLGEVSS